MVVRICENGHEVSDDGLFYCPVCRSVELRPAGAPAPAPEPEVAHEPMVDVAAARLRHKRDDALSRMRRVGVVGVVLYVVGLVIVAASSGSDTRDGSLGGFLLGALCASVGGAMVLVFLVGWGVKLGREAADV